MPDKFVIDAYLIGDSLYFVANSAVADGSVVFELPSERCELSAPDEELGSAILRTAARCREGVSLQGAGSDDVAKALGFKSNADIRKKLVPFVISRSGSGEKLAIYLMRRQKSQVVFTGEELLANIDDKRQIGQLARAAAKTSTQ